MSGKQLPFTAEGLLVALRRFPTAPAYRVAYSGGADSTALLSALLELGERLEGQLRALHVNHGLHAQADAWQRHCESFCRARGVELHCARISISKGAGTEAEARRLRYRVAENLLGPGEVLLTAHHSDDQAETVLLNLMRGSGVDGLAGMPAMRPLGEGWLARPLLGFTGASLRAYLEARDVRWIEDLTNTDESYDRNYVRHSLIPVLNLRWNNAAGKIALSADHCREASGLLASLADRRLSAHLAHPRLLELDSSLECDRALFKQVVRRWLRVQDVLPMPARRLEELYRQCARASTRQQVEVRWDGWVVHLFRRRLWLQPIESLSDCPDVAWRETCALDLGPVSGQLSIDANRPGLPDGLHVGPRRGGEKIHFKNESLHRSVKALLHAAAVPPWMRSSIPVLRLDGEAVALGDWAIGSRLETWLESHHAKLAWRPAEPLLSLVHSAQRGSPVDRPGMLG